MLSSIHFLLEEHDTRSYLGVSERGCLHVEITTVINVHTTYHGTSRCKAWVTLSLFLFFEGKRAEA